MAANSFMDLKVWQRAMDLMLSCYALCRSLPPDERFGIISQLQRASLSVASNISEGNGRRTRGEYMNQLSVAQGSLNEVQTLLVAIHRLGYASKQVVDERLRTLEEVGRMLSGLRQALRPKRKAGTGD